MIFSYKDDALLFIKKTFSNSSQLAGTDLGKNFVLGINVSLMALTFDMIIIRWAERRKALLGLI